MKELERCYTHHNTYKVGENIVIELTAIYLYNDMIDGYDRFRVYRDYNGVYQVDLSAEGQKSVLHGIKTPLDNIVGHRTTLIKREETLYKSDMKPILRFENGEYIMDNNKPIKPKKVSLNGHIYTVYNNSRDELVVPMRQKGFTVSVPLNILLANAYDHIEVRGIE